jgi:hypothetical protein
MRDDTLLLKRIEQANHLRTVARDPAELSMTAKRLLATVPDNCDVLVAWSNEGFGIAAAAAVLANEDGRRLGVERASHVAPLGPAPAAQWTWINVEHALGVGAVRPWAKDWAERRGGRLLVSGEHSDLDLVA